MARSFRFFHFFYDLAFLVAFNLAIWNLRLGSGRSFDATIEIAFDVQP